MDAYWTESARQLKQLIDAHEHVWVPSRLSGTIEECSVPGCSLARYSPDWIARMRASSALNTSEVPK
jgi:hypothetical protein